MFHDFVNKLVKTICHDTSSTLKSDKNIYEQTFNKTIKGNQQFLVDHTLQHLLDGVMETCEVWDFNNYLAHAAYVQYTQDTPSENRGPSMHSD